MAAKKTKLELVKGGGKKSAKPALAVNRPLIRVVPASELDPKKGLSARSYITPAEDAEEIEKGLPLKARGRSRVYPEINVLNAAKGWHRSMVRFARSQGFGPENMKKFFKEAHITDMDKKLFDMVQAFINWEHELSRTSDGS